MSQFIGGIDPHQANFTVGIITPAGIEITHEAFPNSAAGYVDAIALLSTHGVEQAGVECSASWGAHVAIALAAAGFDAHHIPPQRSAAQRRSRRLDKTDAVDAVACARALAAEPTHGRVQVLEVHSPLLARIEAVLEHRPMLVELRTLMLHHVADQLAKLPTDIRDRLTADGKIEGRLRRLEEPTPISSPQPLPANTGSDGSSQSSNATAMNAVRSVAWNVNSMIFSTPTGPRCVRNRASGRSPRRRFSSRPATHSGSRQSPSLPAGAAPVPWPSRPEKARDVTSPTEPSDACGKTKNDASPNPSNKPLDKGASQSLPGRWSHRETSGAAVRVGGSFAHPGVNDLAGIGPGGEQRVIAEDFRVPVGGALFGLAGHLTDRGVHVDHDPALAGSGAHGPRPCERVSNDGFELADMTEREGA